MQRASWTFAGVACAMLASGCSHTRAVDDGQVINGVAANARAVPGGVTQLSPSETVLLYNGEQLTEEALARPDHKAILNFIHEEEVKEQESGGGGCGLGACLGGLCSGPGPCKSPPKLQVQKYVEHDGYIERELTIDVDQLPPYQREQVPIAFHFMVSNGGCGKANKVMLVDALPEGFHPTNVELEDLSSPSAGTLFYAFFPLIIPGIIVLATHHGALMRFDDVAWDLKQLGPSQVLVVSAKMQSRPLEEGDFFYLKVSGMQEVPHRRMSR